MIPMPNAVIPTGDVEEDIPVTVTAEDVARGVVEYECPACKGTGIAFWAPGYPEGEGPGCVECSTRGTRCASV